MKKLVITIYLVLQLSAQEYVVVGSKSLSSLTKTELKHIFLKKRVFLNGVKLIPLNLPTDTKIRQSFEKNILQLSRARLRAYWTKEHYLGHRPPKKQKSQQSILKFVENVDGAIGYVESTLVNSSTNVLYRWRDN